MNTPKEAEPEVSFPKAFLFSIGYFALLVPSLSFAWNRYMDLADPPVVNPNVNHSFLLSAFGGWLWFGATFVLPALLLFASSYILARVRKAFGKSSGAVA
jgi:hypothetical protein